MRKLITSIVLAVLFTTNVSAQDEWTINTRAWSTNYFTTLLWDAVAVTTKEFVFDGDDESSLANRIIPTADLVFPFSVKKSGFGGPTEIYCPYHRAFSNPIARLGDYGIGPDASWKPSFIGIYAGAYYKSQEVVFKQLNGIRANYIQPRFGLVAGKGNSHALEVGMFYDILTGSGGRMAGPKKEKLRSGFGLDVAYSRSHNDGKYSYQLQVSVPFHNFFSKDVEKVDGFKRKVGYIMLTTRIAL
jgi:hypothetical protein